MTDNNFADVGDFHHKFGLNSVDHKGAVPQIVGKELLQFRLNFLLEELTELLEACDAYFEPVLHPVDSGIIGMRITVRDDSEVNDALAFDALLDLAYVTFGMAHIMGYPWQQGWDLVQAANMGKVRAAGDGSDSKRGSSFDVVKPEGWKPPDIEDLIKAWQHGLPAEVYVCPVCRRTESSCEPGYCAGVMDDPVTT